MGCGSVGVIQVRVGCGSGWSECGSVGVGVVHVGVGCGSGESGMWFRWEWGVVQVGVGCGSGRCGGGGTNGLCVTDSKKYRFFTGEKSDSTGTFGECLAQLH